MHVCILMLIVSFNNIALCEQSDLLSVTVLYRHGSRSPNQLYINDPYRDEVSKIWPEGLGELTNIGKNQAFSLGQWYREKYKKFIPEKYNNNFIRVLSSNKDRCLMTAACSLAGLFPPKDKQIWNDHIQWQPIPIHTIPEKLDGIINNDERHCKKLYRLYPDLMRSEMITKYLESKKTLFEYVSNRSGENISNHIDVVPLYDALFIENYYNFTLPDWTKTVFPHELEPIVVTTLSLDTNTTELKRIMAGLLVNYITTFFEDVLSNPTTSQKFLMLSGHDITITRLMNTLDIFDYTMIEYTATLVFELRRKGQEVFLRIYFKDSKKFQYIKLPHCKLDCSFGAFKNITKPFRINEEEWIEECESG